MTTPLVGIIMGSKNDWDVMQHASTALSELDVPHEGKVISAHRTPARHHDYVTRASERGLKVLIAGAGMAAHLAGVTAALTHLPVFGVPLKGGLMDGMDSLLATVQMPGGIPVGTLAVGKAGAKNAALLACAVLALSDEELTKRLIDYRARMTAAVPESPQG
ncbi:MAG: 5-(carboxyamino)imidazole ribonucleotide mutase [Pseudomonadota bacterium]